MNKEEKTWDFKKIILFSAAIGLVFFGLKIYILDNNKPSSSEVISASEKPLPTIFPKKELQQTFNQKINDLTKEVNNINVAEIATSTPQVQKILNDLKNLQKLPQNQAKEACLRICDGL